MASWRLEVREKVGVLTFTRPPANWMDLASMTELVGHLEAVAARSDEITVVMLTGGVDGYFIAHADLDDLALSATGGQPAGDPGAWGRATRLLESMPQPTVAAIDGQAWGGGCETALACSMRIGSERAHLAQPEVVIGIIPGAGGTQRLARLVGQARAIELCTSGRRVFADEALRIGLLNAVLPTDGFADAALQWCAEIARHSPVAVIAAKRAVVEGMRGSLEDGLALEGRMFADINASDDARFRNASVSRPEGHVQP